ncbi:DNA phosphorothioation-dependent restriction protein DptH [Paenibacillus sp. LHD-117]|uniref:DNA phosphorothioation-dependent restriction protein DptH n=1 Tax=Paenibacillus sp. LHD-117 TaxID=3071412 RepID=UPI0027E1041B|nr:DNA phosphorothioation-dependent restriction protein DptH [Paenibacillus sp. LHD-117]MDQ6423052.1 DNA phosphorothioation-dependent restriction protein DptH [Paenibacillus sp. LHD-117]
MSNPFYEYLARKVDEYFTSSFLLPGDKYHIYFDRDEHVFELLSFLRKLNNSETFQVKDESGHVVYETFSLNYSSSDLVVGSTSNATPDYLTRLRNSVGTATNGMERASFLLIHNSNLDSLVHGMDSFYKEGMPFHIKVLEQDIKQLLATTSLSGSEKRTLEFIVTNKKAMRSQYEETTLFDFIDVLTVLNRTKISNSDYTSFGLFKDTDMLLPTLSDKEFRERFKINHELFTRIDSIYKNGSSDTELERYFDDEGVKILLKPNWQETEFNPIYVSHSNKQNDKGLEYVEEKKKTQEGLIFWEKPAGESKSKQRIRSFLIFNPDRKSEINLELNFNNKVSHQYAELETKVSGVTIDSYNTKLKLRIRVNEGENKFFKIRYKTDTSNKFDFRFALVDVNESFLKGIQTSFSIVPAKEPYLLISSEENEIILNPTESDFETKTIILDGKSILQTDVNAGQRVVLKKVLDSDNEEETVRFNVSLDNSLIPFAIEDIVERPAPITAFTVWKHKMVRQEHFYYKIENEKMKIIHGTRETFAQGEFKKSLEREYKLIHSDGLYFQEGVMGLFNKEIDVPDSIRSSYHDLITYFRTNKLLPSLAYMDEEYISLAQTYINSFINELANLENGQLTQTSRNMGLVGTIDRTIDEKEWLFSPLHPMNLAFQMELNKLVAKQDLQDELMKTFSGTFLIPHVRFGNDTLYKVAEHSDAYEWNTYVNYDLPRYDGNRSFVNKLVYEKIEEFIEHFTYLFDTDESSPLKINVVNMGDCREIAQGVLEFYKRRLKKKIGKDQLIPINISIYSETTETNAFEEIAELSKVEDIEERFNLKLSVDNYLSEEVINIFHDKITFFSKDAANEKYEYSHLTFYQMKKIEQIADSKMVDIPTGLSLFGLSSGVPSSFVNGNYLTGFGSKSLPDSNNLIHRLGPRMNALLRVARNLNSYQDDTAVVTAISSDGKHILNKIYDSSHWVTFVEPRVDLSFFKNDSKNNDLLVIHYNDQYTTSNALDAITVTRRSKQYQVLIQDFLGSKGVPVNEDITVSIINLFNALNGNWLLRLLAQNNHFPKEKLSILSAAKLALAFLWTPEIVWIPISMEEVLRISGGAGLKQAEGLFSAKNLRQQGSFSDDLLCIGIEMNGNNIPKVHLCPVEVKIGINNNVQPKAIAQVKETNRLLYEFLTGEIPSAMIYRNFFIQLALANLEKLVIYDTWPEQNYKTRIDHFLIEKLLNDNYTLSNELNEILGEGIVISFKRDIFFAEAKKIDNVMYVSYPEKSGYNFVIESVEKLKSALHEGKSSIDKSSLLENCRSDGTNTIVPDRIYEKNELVTVTAESSESYEFNFLAPDEAKPLEVLFGSNIQNGDKVNWFPTSTNKVLHTNTGIIGTMGTGKTQFTKSLVAQLNQNSDQNLYKTPIKILIFDYKGDYIKDDFVNATSAKVYDLFHLPYNPLSLFITHPVKPLLPVHTSSTLTDTISTAFNLGPVQTITLKDLIMDAYANKGILKADSSTWGNPAPTFSDIFELFRQKDGLKIDSLYAALKDLYDTEVFEPDATKTIPLFDLIEGITVINLSGYNDSIQNLVVAITLDTFYNQMQMSGHSRIQGNIREITRMILVDEADNFLSKDFKAIKKILKEGREFGVGTILSTQFLSHFSTNDNDYANYILTWVLHNVSELSSKEIRMIFNTQSKIEEENIMSQIKKLEKHHSVVKGIGKEPILMRDKAFWELFS